MLSQLNTDAISIRISSLSYSSTPHPNPTASLKSIGGWRSDDSSRTSSPTFLSVFTTSQPLYHSSFLPSIPHATLSPPTQRLHQPIHLRSLVRRRREAHRNLYASRSSHASTECLRGAVLAPLAREAIFVVRLHVRKTQVELPTLHHRQHVLLPFRDHPHP